MYGKHVALFGKHATFVNLNPRGIQLQLIFLLHGHGLRRRTEGEPGRARFCSVDNKSFALKIRELFVQ